MTPPGLIGLSLGLFNLSVTLNKHFFFCKNDFMMLHFMYFSPVGEAIVGILLCLGTAEFINALIAAIFSCTFACCGGNGCCDDSLQGKEL